MHEGRLLIMLRCSYCQTASLLEVQVPENLLTQSKAAPDFDTYCRLLYTLKSNGSTFINTAGTAFITKKIKLLFFFLFKHLIGDHSMYEITGSKSHSGLFYFQEWLPFLCINSTYGPNPLEEHNRTDVILQGIFSTKLIKIHMRLWKTKRS